MTDTDRIARLELVLGSLITSLHSTLGTEDGRRLLEMLNDDDTTRIPDTGRVGAR